MEQSRKRTKRKSAINAIAPIMSQRELARLGGGQIAYIKILSTAQARAMFPSIEGLPDGSSLFALHAADGTPIALTDSHQAAIGHAMEGELEIASVN